MTKRYFTWLLAIIMPHRSFCVYHVVKITYVWKKNGHPFILTSKIHLFPFDFCDQHRQTTLLLMNNRLDLRFEGYHGHMFIYLIFLSIIVLYFLHSTSVLSFYIDVVLTLSIYIRNDNHQISRCEYEFEMLAMMQDILWHDRKYHPGYGNPRPA